MIILQIWVIICCLLVTISYSLKFIEFLDSLRKWDANSKYRTNRSVQTLYKTQVDDVEVAFLYGTLLYKYKRGCYIKSYWVSTGKPNIVLELYKGEVYVIRSDYITSARYTTDKSYKKINLNKGNMYDYCLIGSKIPNTEVNRILFKNTIFKEDEQYLYVKDFSNG